MSDIGIEKSGHVALVEIRRPPNNFFDIPLIKEIAGAFESFDDDIQIRAVVLAAQGKAFCAGANFGDGSMLDAQGRRPNEPGPGVAPLYIAGNRRAGCNCQLRLSAYCRRDREFRYSDSYFAIKWRCRQFV